MRTSWYTVVVILGMGSLVGCGDTTTNNMNDMSAIPDMAMTPSNDGAPAVDMAAIAPDLAMTVDMAMDTDLKFDMAGVVVMDMARIVDAQVFDLVRSGDAYYVAPPDGGGFTCNDVLSCYDSMCMGKPCMACDVLAKQASYASDATKERNCTVAAFGGPCANACAMGGNACTNCLYGACNQGVCQGGQCSAQRNTCVQDN